MGYSSWYHWGMPKSIRHQMAIKFTPPEYAALSADAQAWGCSPTTLVLCDALAALQERRGVVPDLTVPTSRACQAMKIAADALRAAGDPDAAAALDTAGRDLATAGQNHVAGKSQIIGPGWRLDAFRHRIDWSTGLPVLDDPDPSDA